jgi:2-methylcitrate dehydratase PrpD
VSPVENGNRVNSSSGITKRLADCVVSVNYDSLPPEVTAVAKTVTLDGIGNMLAGSVQPLGEILIKFVQSMGGVPTATVIGTQVMTNAAYAAFANAAFCHSMDYEAMWWPPTHPTSPVLPALLALSEQEGLSGKRVLEALIAGFEVQGRLNITVDWIQDPYAYFHPPGTIGVVGSAAACAKLLGLDAWKTRMAIGIAASRAGGIWANSGTMTKSQHSANSARSGVESALLARAGYTSNEDVLESKTGGFVKLFFGDEADLEMIVRDFGSPYRMVDPGLTFKKYPAQTTTHWCIDAALELRNRHRFAPADIAEVSVVVGDPNWSAQWLNPKSGLDGKFSIHYTVALALIDGKVVIDSFTDERRFASDMEQLLGKIRVREDKSIPPGLDFPNTWAIVTVNLKDGRALSARCDKPKGRGGNPLTRDEVLAKFRDCGRRVLSDEAIDRVITQVDELDRLKNTGELFSALHVGPRKRGWAASSQ